MEDRSPKNKDVYYVSILTLCPYVLNMARRRKAEVGRPKMEDPRWKTQNGSWKTEDGSLKTEDGSLKMRTSGLVII